MMFYKTWVSDTFFSVHLVTKHFMHVLLYVFVCICVRIYVGIFV